MIYQREALASVVPRNDKPGADPSQNCEVAIMRTDYPWRRHGVLLSTAAISDQGDRFRPRHYFLPPFRSTEMNLRRGRARPVPPVRGLKKIRGGFARRELARYL
jgi:hypothetical protein